MVKFSLTYLYMGTFNDTDDSTEQGVKGDRGPKEMGF